MKLYLVRHGDYDSKDMLKRLTQGGRDDIRHMADYLCGREVNVQEIWHSPKTRAMESAEIFQNILSCPLMKEKDCLSPNASPDEILKMLAESEDDVMIVSHLPFIPHVFMELTGQEVSASFPTAAVAVLQRLNGRWECVEMIAPGRS